MGFVERLEAKSAAALPGPPCGVATFLDTLDAVNRQDVAESMRRVTTIKTSVLQSEIQSEFGAFLSSTTLQRHRKGKCRCARTT